MAEIIVENDELNPTFVPYSVWRVCLVGLATGFLYWGLTSVINLAANSINVAGDISTVVTATFAILLMVRLRMVQPLIIAVASGLSLWGLASWTSGLPVYEVIIWSIVLHGLAYVLFSWITKINQVVPVLSLVALSIIAVRIILSL